GHVLASVANGDGGEHAYYLRAPTGTWTKIADFEDNIKHVEMGRDGRLYLLNFKDAPRGNVLVLSRSNPVLAKALIIVPQGDDAIEAVRATRYRLFVTYMAGGPSEVRVHDLAGK